MSTNVAKVTVTMQVETKDGKSLQHFNAEVDLTGEMAQVSIAQLGDDAAADKFTRTWLTTMLSMLDRRSPANQAPKGRH